MIHNFRDIGGYKTKCDRFIKSGLIFRTGNLSHIDQVSAQKIVADHDVKIYIDFRGDYEIDNFGKPDALINEKVEWIRLPINAIDPDFKPIARPNPLFWLNLYKRLFEKNMDHWVKFIKILAESDAPLAYGCLFGKDRTGVASSILLEVLNVHDDHILKDYSETEKHINPLYQRFKMLWKDYDITEQEVRTHHLATPPEIMDGFLEHLRTQLIAEEAKLLIDHLPYDTRTKLQNRLLD